VYSGHPDTGYYKDSAESAGAIRRELKFVNSVENRKAFAEVCEILGIPYE
jgi:hypothetical protein